MSKRIILCFDGEWHRPPDPGQQPAASKSSHHSSSCTLGCPRQQETNVYQLYRSILPRTDSGLVQQKWYDSGIDQPWFHRFREGSFGYGLDRSILLGYACLTATYQPGDEIFLYGFSRGAYTARSLVGLLAAAGLPSLPLLDQDFLTCIRAAAAIGEKEVSGMPALAERLNQLIQGSSSYVLEEAYQRYRSGPSDVTRTFASQRRGFRSVSVTLLGIWDTVGPLGIPTHALKWLNEPRYNFHDTELSPIVRQAYHALAIDEHRADHNASLWTSPNKAGQTIEQRWFAGSHGDLGGMYAERDLADISLAWIQRASVGNGLAVDAQVAQEEANPLGPIHDSFSESFAGLRKWVHSRFYRPVMQTGTHTEVIDGSVHTRLSETPTYRPKNEGLGSTQIAR